MSSSAEGDVFEQVRDIVRELRSSCARVGAELTSIRIEDAVGLPSLTQSPTTGDHACLKPPRYEFSPGTAPTCHKVFSVPVMDAIAAAIERAHGRLLGECHITLHGFDIHAGKLLLGQRISGRECVLAKDVPGEEEFDVHVLYSSGNPNDLAAGAEDADDEDVVSKGPLPPRYNKRGEANGKDTSLNHPTADQADALRGQITSHETGTGEDDERDRSVNGTPQKQLVSERDSMSIGAKIGTSSLRTNPMSENCEQTRDMVRQAAESAQNADVGSAVKDCQTELGAVKEASEGADLGSSSVTSKVGFHLREGSEARAKLLPEDSAREPVSSVSLQQSRESEVSIEDVDYVAQQGSDAGANRQMNVADRNSGSAKNSSLEILPSRYEQINAPEEKTSRKAVSDLQRLDSRSTTAKRARDSSTLLEDSRLTKRQDVPDPNTIAHPDLGRRIESSESPNVRSRENVQISPDGVVARQTVAQGAASETNPPSSIAGQRESRGSLELRKRALLERIEGERGTKASPSRSNDLDRDVDDRRRVSDRTSSLGLDSNTLPDPANPNSSVKCQDDTAELSALEAHHPIHGRSSARTVDPTMNVNSAHDLTKHIDSAQDAARIGRLVSDAGQGGRERLQELSMSKDVEQRTEAALIDDEFGFLDAYTPIGVAYSGTRETTVAQPHGDPELTSKQKSSLETDSWTAGSSDKDAVHSGQEFGTSIVSAETRKPSVKIPEASLQDARLDIAAMNSSIHEESGALLELSPKTHEVSRIRANISERRRNSGAKIANDEVVARPGWQGAMRSGSDGDSRSRTAARAIINRPQSPDGKLEPQGILVEDERDARSSASRVAPPAATGRRVRSTVIYDLGDDADDTTDVLPQPRQALSPAADYRAAKAVSVDDDEIEVVGFTGPRFRNTGR